MRGGSFAIAFYRDEAGVLTILSLLFFVMLMAAGGLSIDLGRLYGERGQMQAFADSAALSAASQLDRSHDAMDRAVCAVMGTSDSNCTASQLISGSETFSTTPGDFTVTKVTFLQSLDPDWQPTDATPAPNDKVLCAYTFDTSSGSGSWSASSCNTAAANNAQAQYVEVVTAPRTVSYFLLPIIDFIGKLKGASSTVSQQSLSLRATAGYKQILCDNIPLMMCNPDESMFGSGADFDTYNPATGKGRDDGKQVHAKYSGTAASLAPGMFGLLSVYGGNSANELRDALAQVDPNTSCTEDNVKAKNGQATGPTLQGMDVRFDMYLGPMKANDDQNAPAPDVTKGLKDCNTNKQSSSTMPFPRDSCFMGGTTQNTSTCVTLGGGARMGAGDWNAQAYWQTNHGGSLPAALGANPSRYEVYRYEIETPAAVNLGDEHGQPMCYKGNPGAITYDRDHDRRVLLMAVVNCSENASELSSGIIPVKAYAKVFLTEPVGNTGWPSGATRGGLTWGSTNNDDIYAEIIGVVKPGDDTGKLHQFPVLYR